MGFETASLPAFPWDRLEPYAATARAHPGGICDLSVGTPVDPSAAVAQQALIAAADSPGYPATYGSPALREAVVEHYARRRGTGPLDPRGVLPTLGSKEFVAHLPSLLGLGRGDVVIHPSVAYPTYDIGARLAGATPLGCDAPSDVPDDVAPGVRLVWLNSPGNPTGQVLGRAELAAWVAWARQRGAVLASDECYAELAWAEPWARDGVPSVLDERVSGAGREGVLALYSLSKQSALAGYRAAWVAGDPDLVLRLLELRKHIGMMMPGPVQAALEAALADDRHVAENRARYGRRRDALRDAILAAGLQVDHSAAGLYLWVRSPAGAGCWELVEWFAQRGVLVAPGEFYGPGGARHVRLALTASDERIAAVTSRLSG